MVNFSMVIYLIYDFRRLFHIDPVEEQYFKNIAD